MYTRKQIPRNWSGQITAHNVRRSDMIGNWLGTWIGKWLGSGSKSDPLPSGCKCTTLLLLPTSTLLSSSTYTTTLAPYLNTTTIPLPPYSTILSSPLTSTTLSENCTC